MKKICVIGSLNMDLVVRVDTMPKRGQTLIGNSFKEIPGGKGANQAVAIGRLDSDIRMIGKVGNDNFGVALKNQLKNNNVKTDFIQVENCSTGVALITVDKSGENTIVVSPGANYELLKDDIDKCIEGILESDIVVIQLEVPLETVRYVLQRCKDLGKYTILNPAPAYKLDEDIIKNIDLLTPNKTELEVLSGISINTKEDIKNAAGILLKKGVKQLIVTLGAKGSIYIDKNKFIHKDSYKVEVVDTTAAGDSYNGALAVALSQNKEIEEAMDFASRVGALCVMKEGAQSSIPMISDVLSYDF